MNNSDSPTQPTCQKCRHNSLYAATGHCVEIIDLVANHLCDCRCVFPSLQDSQSAPEDRIAEIRKRRAGATAGAWHRRDPNVKSGDTIIVDSDSGNKGSAGQPLLSAVAQVLNFANYMSFDKGHKRCDAQMRRNADFIANAPADIDYLLSRASVVAEQLADVWDEAIRVAKESAQVTKFKTFDNTSAENVVAALEAAKAQSFRKQVIDDK